MNEKNLTYLADQLKYHGFGDKLMPHLEGWIKKHPKEFQLELTGEFGKTTVDYTLDFSKSEKTDMYFFNRYKATLKKDGEEKSQTFTINDGKGVTAKEAYNLLSGRAVYRKLVNKKNEKYNAWLQIDFEKKNDHGSHEMKYFTDAYGFDLEKTVEQLPIKGLQDPIQKEKLLQSLEKGNRQEVTFVRDGKEEQMFIEAKPRFHDLNVYDSEMRPQHQGLGKSNNITIKTDSETSKKKQGRRKGIFGLR